MQEAVFSDAFFRFTFTLCCQLNLKSIIRKVFLREDTPRTRKQNIIFLQDEHHLEKTQHYFFNIGIYTHSRNLQRQRIELSPLRV